MQDLLNLAESCRVLSSTSSENVLWAKHYRAQFGFLKSTQDAKLQYIAAHLFRDARNCKRFDIAQIKYRKLGLFLSVFEDKQWAQYYLGMMYYYGLGLGVNKSRGRKYLLKSAATDYRSAIELTLSHQSFMNAKEAAKVNVTLSGIYNCLLEANRNGCSNTEIALAILQIWEIGNEEHSKSVLAGQQLLLRAVEKGQAEALVHLMDFRPESEIEAFLSQAIIDYADKQPIVAEAQYILSYHLNLQDNPQGLVERQNACDAGHVEAACALGKSRLQMARDAPLVHIKQWLLQQAESTLRPACLLNHAESTRLFMDVKLAQGQKPCDVLASLKSFTLNGNAEAAILIGDYYLFKNYTQYLATDAEKIWWIQLSIQAGNVIKIDELINIHNASPSDSFAAIALGMIYSLGVLGTQSLYANPEKASAFFAEAERRQPGSIAKYLQTGEQEGIICDELKKLLPAQIKPEQKTLCSKRSP
jgi:TPR repeat protein